MKKLIYIFFLQIICLSIVGCSYDKTKKLECKQNSETADYGTQEEIYVITFKENKIIKQTITRKIIMSEALAQVRDDFYASVKASNDEANTKKGIKSESSLKNNTIETKQTITVKNLDIEAKNYIGIDETETYESLKQNFTNNGYTCK